MLGPYTLLGEIGRGGMGKVFAAQHESLCRPCALKVMDRGQLSNREAEQRFAQEVWLSSSLTHPNTVTLYDYGRARDGSPFYVMEYLPGLDVGRLVRRFGPLIPSRTVHILTQVCASVGEAHERGIIHRDLKPSNVFLTERGGLFDFVKVLDFGLAALVRVGDSGRTGISGEIVGTPKYMAPEAIDRPRAVDARSDIYQLGGIAYYLLTGWAPFEDSTALDLLLSHLNTVPERPASLSEQTIPAQLDHLVMRCLEKRPEDRLPSVNAVLAALHAIRFDEPWTHERAAEWWRLHAGQDELIRRCLDSLAARDPPGHLRSAGLAVDI